MPASPARHHEIQKYYQSTSKAHAQQCLGHPIQCVGDPLVRAIWLYLSIYLCQHLIMTLHAIMMLWRQQSCAVILFLCAPHITTKKASSCSVISRADQNCSYVSNRNIQNIQIESIQNTEIDTVEAVCCACRPWTSTPSGTRASQLPRVLQATGHPPFASLACSASLCVVHADDGVQLPAESRDMGHPALQIH